MAKWAIVSDTQFDEQLSYATIRPNGISSRLEDSIRCFDWVVDEALFRNCRGLLHLGDLYDSRTSIDVSVLDQVGRVMWRAHDEGLEIGLLAGNHDSYLRSTAVNSLRPFAGVANIFDEPMVYENFAFVPWVEDDEVFEERVAQLAANKQAEFLFSHCLIAGAVPNMKGARSVAVLQPKRWKQVVLGDVHDPVQVAPNVRYCGSPMQWHYGDAGGKRGFLVLDDQTGQIEFVENTFSPRFHLLDDPDEAGAVRKGDFVRIRTDDPLYAKEIAAAVGPIEAARVDVLAVDLPDEEPRLPIGCKDPHEDVLRRYVEYQGLEDVEGLVELGIELLEEARSGG